MALTEKDLEKQLLEAGNKLLSPPLSVSQLLALLDRIEGFLTRVEQSPSESMNKALSPSMRALIADKLLKHSNVDVRVAVASCISEITRITAPDAPYEDDQMKEVFQLIVSSFEKLDDKSSPSYIKRTTILETVAKVRSCVVMLDLECDSLIVEMFQHFLRSIRDDHPENVFSSMETIMTLILEESEDVSLDLVSSILDFLKTDNKEALPIARKLGEKVVEKCASKLKPYLLPAVKSQGASLKDYSEVVANVCHMAPEVVEPSNGDTASKNLADESDLGNETTEKAVEVAMETLDDAPPSEEVGAIVPGSPKLVDSNGTVHKETEALSAGTDNTKEADCDSHVGIKSDAEPSKANTDSVDDGQVAKSQAKPEKSNKRKGRKTSALKGSSKQPESRLADDSKETDKVPSEQERSDKVADGTHSKDTVADEAGHAENEKEPCASVSSPKSLENEIGTTDVPSPSPSGSLADGDHSRKVELGKEGDLAKESVPVSDIDFKKESDSGKASEEADVSESKSHKHADKKESSEEEKEEDVDVPNDASKEDSKNKGNLDAKSARQQSGKKVEVVSGQSEDKKKRGQGKGTSYKDLAKTPSTDEGKKPLWKLAENSTKDGRDTEKSSKTISKRKRSLGKEEASGSKGYGEELVGSRVEVWWPADKKFYKGKVVSFDSVKMKHKIVYDDGDVEILKLAKEKWKMIEDGSVPNQEHTSDGESPDEAGEKPKGKKLKTSEDSQTKGMKPETPSKKGASTTKSKPTPKSGRKQKESKAEETPKGAESKLDTAKSGAKSKGKSKSPKINTITDANDSGKAKAEEEEVEDSEKSPEPIPSNKTPETSKGKSPSGSKSQKSGRKRKRGGRS